MENRDLIYDMAKRLDMLIEVTKKGEYVGKFRFINNKLHKLNERGDKDNKDVPNVQDTKRDK